MPFAWTLRFDGKLTSDLDALRSRAAAQASDDRLYPPHITLGVFEAGTARASLRELVDALVSKWSSFPVSFQGLGVFPGASPILWVAPGASADVMTCHAAAQAALSECVMHAHYRPGTWVPHVTLTTQAMDPMATLGDVLQAFRPMGGLVEHVDLICFHPIEILQTWHLSA